MLILAPVGRDATLAREMLRRAQVPCLICQTPASLIERVRGGSGPAVIVAEALDAERAAELQAVLEQHPKWSDLPLIIVAGRRVPPAHLRQMLERRNTTLLHRPLKVPTFVTAVRAALQGRLRQYEVRDLLKQLEGRAHQLQRLALQLTQSEERERQRLAQVLHDDLQQILVGAKFHVALLTKRARENHLAEAATDLTDLLEQAIEKSRNLSHELSPPTLAHHGLVASLEWLATRKQQLHGLNVTVEATPEAEPGDSRIRVFLYRCAQELLLNVVKHSGVNDATLRLSVNDGDLILRVQDEGRGYDPTEASSMERMGGVGLLSIRERADLLGGRFEVQATKDVGSTFTLIMPRDRETGGSTSTAGASASDGVERSVNGSGADVSPRMRIVLVDDHRVMRSGLRSLLEEEEGLEIVAEANDGLEAVDLAEQLHPDLILMDVSMPRMDGIEATRRIKTRQPTIRIIGLSMFDDEATAARMRKAGAERSLSKTGPREAMLHAVYRSREPNRQ